MTGTHKHKCSHCGSVWEHEDTLRGNVAAHTCQCGAEQWGHHYDHRDEVVQKMNDMIRSLMGLTD